MSAHPPSDPGTAREWWSIFDPRTSLPARAAAFIGGGTLLFTVLIAWLAGIGHRRELEHQLRTTFDTLAYQVSDKLERTVYQRYRELQFAAALVRNASTPEQRRQIVEQLQVAAPDFAWIGLADAAGNIVAATSGIFEGTSVDRQEWFLLAQETPHIGALREQPELAALIPETDTEVPRRFLALAVPVPAPNGRPGGVLAAHLNWGWARDIQLSVVPAGAKARQMGVTVYSGSRDVLLDSGAFGSVPPAPALPDGRQTRGATIEALANGSAYLTGYVQSRGFREYRGIGWMTAVRQPLEEAFAPVRSLRQAIVGAGTVLAAALATAAWIFARRHSRRLQIIGAAATRIQEGDVLTVIPRPQGDTELDRMCRAVGDLVEDIRPKATHVHDAPSLAAPTYSPVERIRRSV